MHSHFLFMWACSFWHRATDWCTTSLDSLPLLFLHSVWRLKLISVASGPLFLSSRQTWARWLIPNKKIKKSYGDVKQHEAVITHHILKREKTHKHKKFIQRSPSVQLNYIEIRDGQRMSARNLIFCFLASTFGSKSSLKETFADTLVLNWPVSSLAASAVSILMLVAQMRWTLCQIVRRRLKTPHLKLTVSHVSDAV